MKKTHKWSDIKRRKLSEDQVAKAEDWAREESLKMDLREIRKMSGLTQTELADRVDLSQAELSRAERRGDRLVSTLRRYVEALGGELEIRVVINNKTIRLTSELPRSIDFPPPAQAKPKTAIKPTRLARLGGGRAKRK